MCAITGTRYCEHIHKHASSTILGLERKKLYKINWTVVYTRSMSMWVSMYLTRKLALTCDCYHTITQVGNHPSYTCIWLQNHTDQLYCLCYNCMLELRTFRHPHESTGPTKLWRFREDQSYLYRCFARINKMFKKTKMWTGPLDIHVAKTHCLRCSHPLWMQLKRPDHWGPGQQEVVH